MGETRIEVEPASLHGASREMCSIAGDLSERVGIVGHQVTVAAGATGDASAVDGLSCGGALDEAWRIVATAIDLGVVALFGLALGTGDAADGYCAVDANALGPGS